MWKVHLTGQLGLDDQEGGAVLLVHLPRQLGLDDQEGGAVLLVHLPG